MLMRTQTDKRQRERVCWTEKYLHDFSKINVEIRRKSLFDFNYSVQLNSIWFGFISYCDSLPEKSVNILEI